MRLTILVTLALATLVAVPQAGAEAPPAPPFCGPATTTSQSNTTPTPIPSLAVTASTIEVSGAGAYLTDVDLFTDIRHTWSADLDMTLQSPAGTIVTITTDNGREVVDEFAGTTFDDQADPDGQVPYETNPGVVADTLPAGDGVVTPLTPEEPLAAFHGENPNGTWTLTISDDLAQDDGTLQSWRLDVQSLATAPPTATASAASDAPVAIPDESVVTSTITVAGAGTHLSDLDLALDVSHTFPRDLDITLMSPAGTVATVTTDNGTGFADLFAGTTFDDQSGPGGQVPYVFNDGLVTDRSWPTLRFVATLLTPEEPLAAFDGEDPNGTWTLTISDDQADDIGELRGWRLDVTTGACPPPPPSMAGEKPAATGDPAGGTPPVAAAGARLRVRADRLSVFSGAAARCRGARDECRVRVLVRGRVIARGSADRVRVPLRLTRAGARLLARRFGGIRAKVVATDGERRART
ncbi:MAG TPA: proprotein convertase P-domain-containing protein, partial [Solirubrobacteraceae bacterium]|nr:proprotein convertase P-domain-containing protein [Solirubrobacteraceae bacterium]